MELHQCASAMKDGVESNAVHQYAVMTVTRLEATVVCQESVNVTIAGQGRTVMTSCAHHNVVL